MKSASREILALPCSFLAAAARLARGSVWSATPTNVINFRAPFVAFFPKSALTLHTLPKPHALECPHDARQDRCLYSNCGFQWRSSCSCISVCTIVAFIAGFLNISIYLLTSIQISQLHSRRYALKIASAHIVCTPRRLGFEISVALR